MIRKVEEVTWLDGLRALAAAVSMLGVVSYLIPPYTNHLWKIGIPLAVLGLSVLTARRKVVVACAAVLFLLARGIVALIWRVLGVLPGQH